MFTQRRQGIQTSAALLKDEDHKVIVATTRGHRSEASPKIFRLGSVSYTTTNVIMSTREYSPYNREERKKRKREWREGQRNSDEILREARYVSIELNKILQCFLQSGKQSLNQKGVRM
jgi:hypothetical protein